LPIDEAVAAVWGPWAGALDLFIGVVRDENEGKRVASLEYEAYEPMAEAWLRRIEDETESRFSRTRARVLHRIGRLLVGDVAVVCVAASPRRAIAFEACRYLIERVKADVPIWKREHTTDGTSWVGWGAG
jgi:molybdopterin synthase catalytic subunit